MRWCKWCKLLALCVGCPLKVVGYDFDAHDAIGQTTASAMDQQAIKQLKRMLGGKDASDVAGWGHQVDDTFPGFDRLHFQVHDDSKTSFCAQPPTAKCEDNICLVTAIKHFYGKVLSDEGRKTEFPAINYNKAAKGVKITDADAVKMLINLLGDLHQPMHVGFQSDDMGRKVEVKFRGKVMSLYDMWDKGISETVRNEESNFWLGGWTHVARVKQEFDKDKELFQKEGAFKTFDRWYNEAVKLACEQGYALPSGKKLAGPDAIKGPVEIDEATYQHWRQLFLHQILMAGARTAIVLNDILDAAGAAKLSEKSAIETKADKATAKEQAEISKERDKVKAKERAARRWSGWNFRIFITNLSIAAVVVPLFLLFVNYGINPNAYRALLKSLTQTDDSGTSYGAQKNAKRNL